MKSETLRQLNESL